MVAGLAAARRRRIVFFAGGGMSAVPPMHEEVHADAESEEEQRQRDERRAAIQAQLAQVPREERIYKYGAELRTYRAHLEFDASEWFSELKMPILIV